MHKGKLEAISFCFPSGWVPSKGLGEGFNFLHNPVADNELLIKSSKKLTKYMCKNTIQRWVWNITTINGLSQVTRIIFLIMANLSAFTSFTWLIRRVSALQVASVDYLVPIVGVSAGVVFLNESFNFNIVIAGVFIFISLVLNTKEEFSN